MSELSSSTVINHVRPPSDAGEYMNSLPGELVSEDLTIGWAEQPKGDGPSQDTVYAYIDPDSGNGRFGVFDGAGGSAHGRAAAVAARQELHEDAWNNGDVNVADPAGAFERFYDTMAADVGHKVSYGYTTAIVGFLDRTDGQTTLRWGAAGDSLGFLLRGGTLTQINREETLRQDLLENGVKENVADVQGNIITNALGANEYQGLNQQGSFAVEDGDILLFVSDGITGDRAGQRLQGGDNMAVIKNVLSMNSLSPREKAQMLIELATKHDDRTALVVEIKGDKAKSVDAVEPTDSSEQITEIDAAEGGRVDLHHQAVRLTNRSVCSRAEAMRRYEVNGDIRAIIELPTGEGEETKSIALVDYGPLNPADPPALLYRKGKPQHQIGHVKNRYELRGLYSPSYNYFARFGFDGGKVSIGRNRGNTSYKLGLGPDESNTSAISRNQLTVTVAEDESIIIADHSLNGTTVELPKASDKIKASRSKLLSAARSLIKLAK